MYTPDQNQQHMEQASTAFRVIECIEAFAVGGAFSVVMVAVNIYCWAQLEKLDQSWGRMAQRFNFGGLGLMDFTLISLNLIAITLAVRTRKKQAYTRLLLIGLTTSSFLIEFVLEYLLHHLTAFP